MRILLALLLILPIGVISAQESTFETFSLKEHCPPPGDRLCFGGDYYQVDIYAEVQIFFDTGNPYNITQCTAVFVDNTYVVPITVLKIKERKYNYKVVATLDHPKFASMNKFIFFFSKY
jgi:hypothetical protein